MKNKIIHFVSIILIISLLVLVTMSFPRFWNYAGSPDSWVGFWGSLLGSLLGVVGAYFVMNTQLQSDKKTAILNEKKKERPYFFINTLSKDKVNFEFYNANHSLLNYMNIHVFYNATDNCLEYPLGHAKANTMKEINIFTEQDKPDIIVITAQTLLGESILYIYGSRNGVGITNTLVYDDKKVIEVYTGPDDYHQFNDIIAKITGINLEKKKQ